jgi:penicillin-binding protein-related factor A (putative recombinase)
MTERNMQTIFSKWMKKQTFTCTAVFELKIVKNKSWPFSNLQEHQEMALKNAKSEIGLYHRLTDQPWIKDRLNAFTYKKPFDCLYITNSKAFVVFWFYKPRQKKMFLFVDIDRLIELKNKCERKSATEEMLKNIASLTSEITY